MLGPCACYPSFSLLTSPTSFTSTVAKAPLPPAPVLIMLLRDCQIVQPANNDIPLCILQGLMQRRAHILPTGRYEKRGTIDTIQGDRSMAVVGGGDTAEEKCNNHIEPMTVVVGTVGVAMDSGEGMAKGKMSG
jgi:hypothetical protein